jgi:hypothetical protein
LNVDVAANASGNPRLDLVVLEVLDLQHVGTGSSVQQIRVITGTPTAAATLDNRNGAPALPASCVLLADILVPNGAATIGTADIRDRRSFPITGVVPPLLTKTNMVGLASYLPQTNTNINQAAGQSGYQSAGVAYLPRRIAGANRINWRYLQGATAATGSWVIAIYDASGRLIISTGAVAFAGAANSANTISATITATTFEAGVYYVLFGNTIATAGSIVYFVGSQLQVSLSNFVGEPIVNTSLVSTTGGVTAPTTLLTYVGAQAAGVWVSVPYIALSAV